MLHARPLHDPDALSVYSNGAGFGAWVHESPDGAVVYVAGEIDLATAAFLQQAIHHASRSRHRVVVDMAETTFIDSSGLAVLLQAHRDLGRLPEALTLRSVSADVRRVLEITGVDQVVPLLATGS